MALIQYLTQINIEFGARQLLAAECERVGIRKPLIVTDAGVKAAGVLAMVQVAMPASLQGPVYDGTPPNPTEAAVRAATAMFNEHGCDGLIAVGGGSSLDCAKGVNFLLTNGGSMQDYRGYGKARTPLLPMIGIPTTAGTGSEAQSYAVISDAATHMKMACGDPSAGVRIALLDPELTLTAPRHVTAMAGFDAIAHAVETAVTIRRTPLSDTFSHRAWYLLNDAFERVLLHPADSEARAAMQLGAHFAGMAIEQSMLGAAHACANPLTARYNLAHGLALAILLPHVVRWNARVASERYAALMGSPRRRARDEDAAETLARRLEDLARAGALAMTLSDSGVAKSAIPELAAQAAAQWTGTFNPRPFDAEGAAEIYRSAL